MAWACTIVSIKIKTHPFLTPSNLSQTNLVTYGSHNWTANIRHISHISTLFLYSPPPPPNSKYMYTNMCVRTHTHRRGSFTASAVSSSKNDWACDSFSHCCVDTKGEGERVKRMIEDEGEGCSKKPFCFSSKFSQGWDVRNRAITRLLSCFCP